MTRILLVDPDVHHAEALASSLRGLGREITCCSNHQTMTKLLREKSFDAVILYSYQSGVGNRSLAKSSALECRTWFSLPSFVSLGAIEGRKNAWPRSEKGFGSCMRDSAKLLLEEVDFVLAERSHATARGLTFRVVHRYRPYGENCVPGEQILAISLIYRGGEYQLPLSPALLIVADFLLRNSRYSQTASQIAAGIHRSKFHAVPGADRPRRRLRMPRSAIKEYVKRLHRALAIIFRRAKVQNDPRDVLLVEESVSNHVLYRWKAVVEVVHLDSEPADDRHFMGGS